MATRPFYRPAYEPFGTGETKRGGRKREKETAGPIADDDRKKAALQGAMLSAKETAQKKLDAIT
jgi:hypothetical protein